MVPKVVGKFPGGSYVRKELEKEIFTIPNLLSLFRLVLIPVYVTIYLNATTMEHYFSPPPFWRCPA